MTTGITFPETPKARSTRRNIGIAVLALALPCAGCGLWLATTDQALSGWGGILIGLLLLIAGLHGVLSKPQLTVDDSGLGVKGFLLPNSNWSLLWSAVTHVKLMGASPQQALWFESAGRPPRVLEAFRYERFEELLKLVGEKLQALGQILEVVQPSKPA